MDDVNAIGDLLVLLGYLAFVLLGAILFVIKKFGKQINRMINVRKGMSRKSFIYHAKALAYEQQGVYFGSEGMSSDTLFQFMFDRKTGRKFLKTENYSLIEENNVSMMTVARALLVDPEYEEIAREALTHFASNEYDVTAELRKYGGELYFDFLRRVDGDPSSKDARYCVQSCYEDISALRDEVYTYINKHKLQVQS